MLACTAEQMRELDRTAIEDFGIPGVVLMEVAGRGVVAQMGELVADVSRARVAVLCGGGNNGGDGFVVARHLIDLGAEVVTYLVARRERIKGDALVNLAVLEHLGADIRSLRDDTELQQAQPKLHSATVIIDALLGTGLRDDVKGLYRALIECANTCEALKVAVDIPTGLHADSGEVLGTLFHADHTVTFGYPKLGMVGSPGADRVGKLHVVDIGIPRRLEQERPFAARVLELGDVRRLLRPRPASSHKGTFGHLLAIAGSPGKSGAALLCGEAALRSGTGLCTLGMPADLIPAVESKTLEVMIEPLAASAAALDDGEPVFEQLRTVLAGKTCVAVGPGIPKGEGAQRFLARLIRESEVPLVIDADGLNALVGQLTALGEAQSPLILTPHPGEMARLIGSTSAEVQRQRVDVAREFATKHRVYLALKGARTVVATPGGEIYINPTGNAGMATGGTGDVLTGIVAGFVAQRYDPGAALALGVYLHGLAGDQASQRVGQHALIARDLLAEVGAVLKGWE